MGERKEKKKKQACTRGTGASPEREINLCLKNVGLSVEYVHGSRGERPSLRWRKKIKAKQPIHFHAKEGGGGERKGRSLLKAPTRGKKRIFPDNCINVSVDCPRGGIGGFLKRGQPTLLSIRLSERKNAHLRDLQRDDES